MSDTATTNRHRVIGDPTVFSKSITIQPNGSKTVGLGTYTAKDPAPSFTLTYQPDQQDTLGASLDRLDLPDKYMLFYQFSNFGEQPCVVTIERDQVS